MNEKSIKKAIADIKAETPATETKRDVIAAIKAANEPELTLSDEQKKAVLDEYNKAPEKFRLGNAIKAAWPDVPDASGRSKHGILIKSYLASLNIKAFGAHVYIAPKTIVLTDQQKEYIANNAKDGEMKITRDIFGDQTLTNLSAEARAVIEFYKTLPPQVVNDFEVQEVPSGMYKPARTLNSVIWKINSYFKDASGALDKDKLTHKQTKGLEALIGYINTYRFIYQINMFETVDDRNLFESTFLRHTYDKPDLTQEEVDQYIMVASGTVDTIKSWKRKERLERLQEEAQETSEENKFDVTMRLVEAIGKAHIEHQANKKSVNDLLDSLKGKRSKRLEQKMLENGNFNQIFEFWKVEETRKQMLEEAKKIKQNVNDEYDRLNGMDEMRCRIFGLSREEVNNA